MLFLVRKKYGTRGSTIGIVEAESKESLQALLDEQAKPPPDMMCSILFTYEVAAVGEFLEEG